MDKRGKFIAYLSRVLAFSKREETMDERRAGPIIKILCLFSTAALPMAILILLAAALGILPARVARADVYDVINTNASGVGSLRQAILDANERGGHDTITFSIIGTIVLTDTLPQITDDLTISGPGPDSLAISGGNAYRVLEIASSTAVTITGVTVENGIAAGEGDDADGGGIYNEGTVDISNATIYSNTASISGGGIYNAGGTVDISNATIYSNTATTYSGGGIYNASGTVNVSNSTFSGNTADEGGGGIYTFGGPLNITNSTFSGNTAREGGGGVCCDSDVLNISNSTFSDNMAVLEEGGGIYNDDGTVNITNTTIYSNTAFLKGGGIFNENGTTYIANTILAGNSAETSGGNCYNGAEGTITSQGYNVESANDCGLSATGDITNSTTITTTLGTLANNGGPTWTHALQEGSPAVDQIPHGDNGCGTTYTTDQRGYNRPYPPEGSCDIGAFEYQAMPPTPTPTPTGTPTATPTSTPTATDTPTPTPTPTTDPCDAANLINAINTANGEGADTIDLIGVCTYTLTVVDNDTDGPNGLPSITGTITINGHGATIERSSADDFRIFHVASGGGLTLTDITVTNGNADDYGGGIYNEGALNVSNSTLSGNGATYSGGGIYNKSTVAVTNSTLSGNTANYGSGIYNEGTVDISYSTLSGNTAGVEGGGILNIFNDSTVSISHSTLSDNTAGTKGGGVLNNSGTVDISSSSVYSNTATSGGGICSTGTVTITHSTLSSNTAFYGGGVYNESTLSISHSTLSDNGAEKYGGGIFNLGGTALFKNTIVANNTASSGPDCRGTLSSYGYNLVEDTSDCSIIDEDNPDTNITGQDPNLGNLGNNGGPTWTHALLLGSPAVDTGICTDIIGDPVTTDQRGYSRPYPPEGSCDIGAYEYEYETPPTSTPAPTATPTTTSTPTPTATSTSTPTPTMTPTNTSTPTPTPTNTPLVVTCDVNQLINDINTANGSGGADTINLAADCTYTLTDGPFSANGDNGLPSITSEITIHGNGATIERSSGGDTPDFRILHVASGASLTLSNLTIANGDAGSNYGGGIYSEGALNISHSTLFGNTGSYGGGIMNSSGTVDISNSTLSDNTATSGGGIYNESTLNISYSTVFSNTATSGGGIYNGGTVNIKNTIVADNTPDNCDGTMTSQGYNLESGTDCGFALSNANADLGPLQDNGGPTWTHALGDTSEAFDQIPYGQSGCGTNYTTGQRGYIRPYPPEGSCDIGAYEQCTLYGDVNCDCVVNIEDVMLVANRWRCQSEDPCYSEVYDFDQDGDIDVVDIMLVTADWGNACS
jgi:predicted outer membrane repeat protein